MRCSQQSQCHRLRHQVQRRTEVVGVVEVVPHQPRRTARRPSAGQRAARARPGAKTKQYGADWGRHFGEADIRDVTEELEILY